MPFANFKNPGSHAQPCVREEIIHRTTAILIEEVPDGGYARADEVFVIPEEYRQKKLDEAGESELQPRR